MNYKNRARNIVAKNIRYFRLKNGWSQEMLAEKLGTTPSYLSTIETSKRNMRIDYIGYIADILNVSLFDLFLER